MIILPSYPALIRKACFCLWTLWILCLRPAAGAEIGSRIGSFHLPDASGAVQSSQLFSGKAVVLVFWSFKCPVSLAYNDRMEAFQKKYGHRGILLFGVDSSSNETPAEIRANIDNLKFKVPILFDSEGILAEKLEASHCPQVFIFDQAMILKYKGAWDNNKRMDDMARIPYVENAIDAILAGSPVATPETAPFGCSIRSRSIRK